MTLTVNNTTSDLDKGIESMLNFAKSDYVTWTTRGGTKELSDVNNKMITEFNNGFVVKSGSKYVKIMSNNGGSAWAFVVKNDTGKFKKGDILKCAGWSKPATNAARGNVIDGGYGINWTGPLYL